MRGEKAVGGPWRVAPGLWVRSRARHSCGWLVKSPRIPVSACPRATFVWVARRFPLKSCFVASEVRERGHGFGGAERLVFSSAFRLGWSGASAQLEDSPSGLWRTLGKRVGCKPSGVRIPHPPRNSPGILEIPGLFIVVACPGTLRGERGERQKCVYSGGGSLVVWCPVTPSVRMHFAAPCRLRVDPPRDGIIRISPGPEGSKDKGALPGAWRILCILPILRVMSHAHESLLDG